MSKKYVITNTPEGTYNVSNPIPVENFEEIGGSESTGNTNETDPTVPQHVKDITLQDITNWNAAPQWTDILNKPSNLVESVTGNGVDNTDPANPVINIPYPTAVSLTGLDARELSITLSDNTTLDTTYLPKYEIVEHPNGSHNYRLRGYGSTFGDTANQGDNMSFGYSQNVTKGWSNFLIGQWHSVLDGSSNFASGYYNRFDKGAYGSIAVGAYHLLRTNYSAIFGQNNKDIHTVGGALYYPDGGNVIGGFNNTIAEGWGMGMFGSGHIQKGNNVLVAGQSSINLNGTDKNVNVGTDARFIVGNGTINAGSYIRNTPSNAFVVYHSGLVVAPTLTPALIDTQARALVTREYLEANTGGAPDAHTHAWADITDAPNFIESVTGTAVDNTDPLNPIINNPILSLQNVLDVGNSADTSSPNGSSWWELSLENNFNGYLQYFFSDTFQSTTNIYQDASIIELFHRTSTSANQSNISLDESGLYLRRNSTEFTPNASTVVSIPKPKVRTTLTFPQPLVDLATRVLPISVNGIFADAEGNITVPTDSGGGDPVRFGISGEDDTLNENRQISGNNHFISLNQTGFKVSSSGDQYTTTADGQSQVDFDYDSMYLGWNNDDNTQHSRLTVGGGSAYGDPTESIIKFESKEGTTHKVAHFKPSGFEFYNGEVWNTTPIIIPTTGDGYLALKVNGVAANAAGEITIPIGGDVAWADITNKPTEFNPSAHTHPWSEITGKPSTFTPSTHTHLWTDITDKPSTFTPSAHTHVKADITDFAHTHPWSDITGAPAFLEDETDPTVPQHVKDITSTNITNWGTAYSKRVTGLSITGTGTKTVTITLGDGTEVTGSFTDVVGEQGTSDGNDYVSSASFDDTTGVITLTRIDGGTVTVDIDNRFALQSHTHVKADITDFAHTHLWSEITGKPTEFNPTSHTHAWGEITGKPSSFTPSSHTHTKSDITDFAHTHVKADITDFAHTHAWGDITGKPSSFSPSAHTLSSHSDVTITSVASGEILKWNGTAWVNNTLSEAGIKDASWTPTWNEVSGKPSTFTPSSHTHTKSQITDFAHTHVKADITDFAHTHAWGDITGKPTTFEPSAHSHSWSEITSKPSSFTPSAHTLESHSNVTVSSNTAGEILKWSGSAWINNTLAEAGIKEASWTPTWNEVSGKPSTFAPSAHSHSWTEITGKPTTFTPSTHTHAWGDITGVPTFDNYNYWRLGANASYTNIGSGASVNFVATGASSVSRSGNTITIHSTDTNTNTNNYLTGVTWSGGTLTFARSGLSNLTQNIDGRYLRLDTGGTVSGNITANRFYQSSLRELKKNIHPYEQGALDLIRGLEIVTFDYKEGEEGNIGVVADDTAPEFLSKEKDKVNLYNTIFIQAKAIQELKSEVDELKEMVKQLMNR